MNLTGCTFDPDAHVYRIRCRPVPHVTGILRDVVPGWQADPWYLSRGRTVHACVALLAAGKSYDLDLSAQSETDRKAIEGKIAAGRKFMADLRPQWHHVELPVFSAAYQFAGTLDGVGTMAVQGRPAFALVDWKSTLDPRCQWQLGAYSIALKEQCGLNVVAGCCVELRDDGAYKIAWHNLSRSRQEFLGILSAYNCRRAAGIPAGA